MIKLSVNESKWSSLPARTRALILYISIWIFDFGPEKLPGLSRNGLQNPIFRVEGPRISMGHKLRAILISWYLQMVHRLWLYCCQWFLRINGLPLNKRWFGNTTNLINSALFNKENNSKSSSRLGELTVTWDSSDTDLYYRGEEAS